jgi:hypothetical protein
MDSLDSVVFWRDMGVTSPERKGTDALLMPERDSSLVVADGVVWGLVMGTPFDR